MGFYIIKRLLSCERDKSSAGSSYISQRITDDPEAEHHQWKGCLAWPEEYIKGYDPWPATSPAKQLLKGVKQPPSHPDLIYCPSYEYHTAAIYPQLDWFM